MFPFYFLQFLQIFLDVTRNFDRISSKTFSYFFKILSQIFSKQFSELSKCSPSFSLIYISLKYILGLLKNLSILQIFLKFYRNLKIFHYYQSYVSSQIFQKFLKIWFQCKNQCAFLSYELTSAFYAGYSRTMDDSVYNYIGVIMGLGKICTIHKMVH